MKTLLTAIGLAVALAVPVSTIAQGRHDEKPHGVMKKRGQTEKEARAAGTGGRHDEGPTTHGKKKRAPKKASKPEDSTGSK